MSEMIRKNGKTIALFFFLCLFFQASIYGQDRTITGVISDASDGTALIGATVVIKGTTIGTTSNLDGEFSMPISENDTLIVSFIGYLGEEITITDQTHLQLELTPELTELSEIIVVGYGTQKKIEITGAVSSVKSEDMVSVMASDFTKSLQGQVAGVSVIESSGRPGDQANVQIRGLGSISSSASPLYVVDGIPYERNPDIASEEIASVEILKDGAAAAVYGTRASNGVILITTKRGKELENWIHLLYASFHLHKGVLQYLIMEYQM